MFTRKPAVVYIGFAAIAASLLGIASCGGSSEAPTVSKNNSSTVTKQKIADVTYYTQCDGPNMVYMTSGSYGASITVAANDPRCAK